MYILMLSYNFYQDKQYWILKSMKTIHSKYFSKNGKYTFVISKNGFMEIYFTKIKYLKTFNSVMINKFSICAHIN